MTGDAASGGDIRSDRSNGHIVSIDPGKGPVVSGALWIKEARAVQVVVPRRLASVIQTSQHREIVGEPPDVFCAAAADRPKFALPDESLAKIRIERQIVGAEKTGQLQYLAAAELPGIIYRQ